MAHQPTAELGLNEIGVVEVEAQRPLFFDPYVKNRATGNFILIDAITNETVAAGMILQPQQAGSRTGRVTQAEREAARGHSGLAICLPLDSIEVAWALERRLFDQGYAVHILHREENLRQAIRTAVDAGLLAIVAPETAEEAATARIALAPERVAHAALESPDADVAARAIVHALEAAGRLGRPQNPLTGGAGI